MNKITLENIIICYKNFSGAPDNFNKQGGKRSFHIRLVDEEIINQLIADGWNVKTKEIENEDGSMSVVGFLKVNVSMGENSSCRANIIQNNILTPLNEATVGTIDTLPIAFADVTIRPYEWEIGGNSGVTAYLENMYATVDIDRLDALDKKYADLQRPGNNITDESDELPF